MQPTTRQTSISSFELEKQQRREYVDQYFIFKDYKDSHPNANINFNEWLQITSHSTDENTCISRVNIHMAAKVASNICTTATLHPSTDQNITSTTVSSATNHSVLRECTSQLNTNSLTTDSNAHTQRQSNDNNIKNTTSTRAQHSITSKLNHPSEVMHQTRNHQPLANQTQSHPLLILITRMNDQNQL